MRLYYLSLNRHQLDIKHQVAIRGDVCRWATAAIGEGGGDNKSPRATNFHTRYTLRPASYYTAKRKGNCAAKIMTALKNRAIGNQCTGVVRSDRRTLGYFIARTYYYISDL